VTRPTFRFLIQLALFAGVNITLVVGGVGAQTDARVGPISGRIIWIEPKGNKGALKIQEAKGVDPVNASEGMLVRKGYLLTLDPTAKATVICGDGKRRELAPGPQGCPCTKTCTPAVCGMRYDGSTIGATRGPDTDNSTYPVVISPRKTMLRNLRPVIRWAPVVGAKGDSAYRVTLYGESGRVIWSEEVSHETRLNYPCEEPPLTPGQTYKVVVASDGLTSEQDHSPGLGFATLTTEQSRALDDEVIEKGQLNLPGSQTRFLVANLYAAKELYAEAIELLERLYVEMKEPAVARMLGDLYASIGLNRNAEKQYLLALSLTDVNDFDEQGRTQRNLAHVYEALGNVDQAIVKLREAITDYRRLRYGTMIRGLLREERRLKRQRGR
jgi:hypothetical protein